MNWVIVATVIVLILYALYDYWRRDFNKKTKLLYEGYEKERKDTMNVIKIVVDKIPETCGGRRVGNCYPNPCNFLMVGEGLWCFVTSKSIEENNNPYESRPSWCPLVVEECCEWKIITDTVYDPFYKCSNCGYEIDVEMRDELPTAQTIYCDNCGKRIKYVEEE